MSEAGVASRILRHLRDASRVFLSRGLAPGVRGELVAAGGGADELACVRGEVILPTDLTSDDVVVVGHPNWFGRFDSAPVHARAVVVAEPRLGAHRQFPPGEIVMVGGSADPDTAEAGRQRAGRLAKRLGQLSGLLVAYGAPVSGVFVVLVPVDPVRVAASLPGPAEVASNAYPELPGGIRVDVSGVAESDMAAYAAAMEDAIRNARG